MISSEGEAACVITLNGRGKGFINCDVSAELSGCVTPTVVSQLNRFIFYNHGT